MTRLRRCLTSLGVIAMASANLHAGNVKFIANLNVRSDAISPGEIKSVFLEERNSLAGSHVEPVLQKGGPAHDSFLKKYIEKDADSLQIYYRSLVFTGKGSMPKELGSDSEIVRYVARTKGAIGYVSDETSAAGVKTLEVVGGDTTQRKLVTRREPEYPETLKQRGIGGTVRLLVTISQMGSVTRVQVLGGNPILADAAVAAVKMWTYSPGRSSTDAEVNLTFGNP